MTHAEFARYIRLNTRTDSVTFPDADILLYANIVKNDIAKEIKKANEDYFGIELTRNLEAGKRNYGFPRYQLSQIKMVQAKLDGVHWSRLYEFDVNSYKGTTDEDAIRANFAGKLPQFDIFGGELVIYNDSAIADVDGGLKVWSIIFPENLTDLSLTTDMNIPSDNNNFAMPTELHEIWAIRVQCLYKNSKEKPIPLNEREANIKVEQQEAINSLKNQNMDRTVTATMGDTSNDGQDY
jgi:hypothetical protein